MYSVFVIGFRSRSSELLLAFVFAIRVHVSYSFFFVFGNRMCFVVGIRSRYSYSVFVVAIRSQYSYSLFVFGIGIGIRIRYSYSVFVFGIRKQYSHSFLYVVVLIGKRSISGSAPLVRRWRPREHQKSDFWREFRSGVPLLTC